MWWIPFSDFHLLFSSFQQCPKELHTHLTATRVQVSVKHILQPTRWQEYEHNPFILQQFPPLIVWCWVFWWTHVCSTWDINIYIIAPPRFSCSFHNGELVYVSTFVICYQANTMSNSLNGMRGSCWFVWVWWTTWGDPTATVFTNISYKAFQNDSVGCTFYCVNYYYGYSSVNLFFVWRKTLVVSVCISLLWCTAWVKNDPYPFIMLFHAWLSPFLCSSSRMKSLWNSKTFHLFSGVESYVILAVLKFVSFCCSIGKLKYFVHAGNNDFKYS